MNGGRAIPGVIRLLLLLGLGFAAVQSALIPLAPGSGLVPPDLLYCLIVAWMLRDPSTVPLWLVLALGVFADLMLSRPLGLGALGLVLAGEAARSASRTRSIPFLLEWAGAVAGYALILLAINAVLHLSFADPPGVLASARYLAATALAYPIIAMVVARGVGLRAQRSA
jgi:rod shape-determining protein MreD